MATSYKVAIALSTPAPQEEGGGEEEELLFAWRRRRREFNQRS